MAAITAVTLQGFQSHVDSNFYLGEGLNVITGPSDAGKTAIIRAIRWVAFNEPQGEAFVNETVGEATVKITLENAVQIIKRRRKGKTAYIIKDPFGEESLFEKSEVPEEVKRLLQIEKQTFGDFEAALNFAFQLDAPFLISETASAGAKILGKLAGTESVDLAIKGVSKDTYGARQERTNAEKDIERIAGNMLAYQHIDDAKEAVEVAEMLLEQIEAGHRKYEDLKNFRQIYEVSLEKMKQLSKKLDKLAHVPELEEDLKNIEKAQQRYDQLLQLYSQYSSLQKRIDLLGTQLTKYSGLTEASETVEVIDHDVGKLVLLNSLLTEYQKYDQDLRKTSAVLEKTKDIEYVSDELYTIENLKLQTLIDWKALSVEYESLSRRARMAQDRLQVFQELEEANTLLTSTGEEYERLAALKRLKHNYDVTAEAVRIAKSKEQQAQEALNAAKAEEAAAWEAAGGICPLCEQPHEGGACG